MSLSAAERSTRARIAALTRWGNADGREGTATARAAFLGSFERKVLEAQPDLPPDEVTRRATRLRKAHMHALALKSAQARRARKASA